MSPFSMWIKSIRQSRNFKIITNRDKQDNEKMFKIHVEKKYLVHTQFNHEQKSSNILFCQTVFLMLFLLV